MGDWVKHRINGTPQVHEIKNDAQVIALMRHFADLIIEVRPYDAE